MFGKTRRIGLVMILSMLLLSLSAMASGQASASQAPTSQAAGHVASSGSRVRADAAQAYWTPQRMQSARSADELAKYGKLTHKAAVKGPAASGKPAAPTTPQKPATLSKVGISTAANQLPQYYYQFYPYSTIGKIFFTDSRTGFNYVCSGTAVNSNNKNVVDTAGHCVVQGGSGGNWYTNWIFCPQYYYGSSPHGCWSARYYWTYSDWLYSGSLEDDFGDVVVWPNGNGNLVDVVGGTGWAYNYPTNQFFYPFGYPQAAPFDGNTMWYCAGGGTGYGWDDGTVVAVSCDMTGGSSGGGWLTSINGSFGYVNGHNDFITGSLPGNMFSPYYDGDWFTVFNSAQNT